jgi:hypothetical protein
MIIFRLPSTIRRHQTPVSLEHGKLTPAVDKNESMAQTGNHQTTLIGTTTTDKVCHTDIIGTTGNVDQACLFHLGQKEGSPIKEIDMKIEVALIMDANFSQNIEELVSRMPVWVVSSNRNSKVVKKIRLENENSQLTEFFPKKPESKVDMFRRIVFTVDEHHNEISQSTPYNVLLVYGLKLNDIDTHELSELGFMEFISTEYGFLANKKKNC